MSGLSSRESPRVLELGRDSRVRLGFGEITWQPSEGNMEAGRTETVAAVMRVVGRSEQREIPSSVASCGPTRSWAWLPLTMDPNHVLQDKDSLCQDLQGLPKLLHPLPLRGGSSQSQGHFASVNMLSRSFPLLPVSINTTATIHSVPGTAFEFLFTDKEPTHREGNQSPLDTQPGSGLPPFMSRGVPSRLGSSCSKLPACFACVPFFPENALRAPRTGPQVGELG